MLPSLADYSAFPDLACTYENEVLYKMCLEVPGHGDARKNAGKVILIGRTYAASPERGAGQSRDRGANFFDAIGHALSKSDIDEQLRSIKPESRIDEQATLQAVIDLHGYLVHVLHRATTEWAIFGTNPRHQKSFASKYLHFHRPNAFPIMDSRAKESLRQKGFTGAFNDYSRFSEAILRFAASLSDQSWTPRSIDRLLLAQPR